MLAFFFSLFRAIASGEWNLYTFQQVNNTLRYLLNNVSSLLVNTLGGNYDTTQTYELVTTSLPAVDIFAGISAIVALVLVCTLTFKLTKMVFSIFFGGR